MALLQTSKTRLLALVILLCAAWYAGVDVVPGPLDLHGSDGVAVGQENEDEWVTAVVRLQNQDGKPITEDQEDKLRPLLERLENAFLADDATRIKFVTKLIEKTKARSQFNSS